MQSKLRFREKDIKNPAIKNWIKQSTRSLKLVYPAMSKSEIKEYLRNEIVRKLRNPECRLHNNVYNVEEQSNLLDVIAWADKEKPIMTEHGVLYKNQSKVDNPAANTLALMKKDRNKYKKVMKDAAETQGRGSRAFKENNRLQGGEKIDMNSYYGASGLSSSIFYNLYNAISTTGKGQAIISTSCAMFESFIADNVKFLDVNEFFTFIDNVVGEMKNSPYKISDFIDEDVSLEKCAKKLHKGFKHKEMFPLKNVERVLSSMSQEKINRLYYKNNLLEFVFNNNVWQMLKGMIERLDGVKDYKIRDEKGKLKYITEKIFIDPSDIPLPIETEYRLFVSLLEEFVLYNHMIMDRIGRLKHEPRAAVVTIDTDSNMININEWVVRVYDAVNEQCTIDNLNSSELRFTIVNILSGAATILVNLNMLKFGETSNIPKEHRPKINMKNEFLFSRMLLTAGKKNYASIIELQEGKFINPGDLDIKGIPITKSVINKDVQEIFKNILDTYILRSPTIQVHKVIQELSALNDHITESLHNGEFTFTSPKSCKTPESYKDPYGNMAIKAAVVWNALYPEKNIELPSSFYVVKVAMEDLQSIIGLAKTHPDIFNTLKENFYMNSKVKQLKKIEYIAIPRTESGIPEWIIPYIKTDVIARDILGKFYPILDSIGITMTPGNVQHHTSVINF